MKTLLIILLLLLCAAPVMAMNVTSYPDDTNVNLDNWTIVSQPNPVHYYTMQDQIVLNALNKQNDLLAELLKAQWVETCYAPHSTSWSKGNTPAWELECAKAGYPVG